MAWHIVKKDLRLLRLFVVIVALIVCLADALRTWVDLSREPAQLSTAADLVSTLSIIGLIFLTVMVMHQDPVPGVRQDWLVRPIRRRDLILAKLLFVVIFVQGPVFIADIAEGLAHSFSLIEVLKAALARNVAILCLVSLPAAMIGVVTRNMIESVLISMASLITYVVVFAVGGLMLLHLRTSTGGAGTEWITSAAWYALALIGAPIVLTLQYLGRRTAAARCLIWLGGALVIVSSFLPWRLAFALQEQLATTPGAANTIALAFDPKLGAFRTPSAAVAPSRVVMYLPLRVTGVPTSGVILLDRASVRIRDAIGKQIYEGRTNLSVDGFGSIKDAQFEVRHESRDPGPASVYQKIFLPAAVLARVGDRPVNLEIAYSMTLFRADANYSLPAAGGRALLGNLGMCTTRIDGEGDDVQVNCIGTHAAPSCFSAYLTYLPAGLRNPEVHNCNPGYAPFTGKFWPDALNRSGGELPFFDRSGLTHYPVDGSKVSKSSLIIETYAARDYFTRRIEISNVRLSDFLGAASTGTAQADVPSRGVRELRGPRLSA